VGKKTKDSLRLQFDKRLRLELHGGSIISGAGLIAYRELDEGAGVDGDSTDLSTRDPQWPECAEGGQVYLQLNTALLPSICC
jgi:hypothetical protein